MPAGILHGVHQPPADKPGHLFIGQISKHLRRILHGDGPQLKPRTFQEMKEVFVHIHNGFIQQLLLNLFL
ncbi:hypothetical protein D3C75_1347540 [compost metagenome]